MDYTELIEQYQEINPANYGPDDVDALNAWGIEAFAAIEALQARVTELTAESETFAKSYGLLVTERDAALAKLAELEKQAPVAYAAVEQEIVQRYRVEKTRGGFWPCCVKAGNGTRDIFVGSQKQAEHVRQALQAACLDGAFMASKARPVPAKTLTDEQIDALWILTPEHDDGNDFVFFARAIETALKGGA